MPTEAASEGFSGASFLSIIKYDKREISTTNGLIPLMLFNDPVSTERVI
jgi:hypothetical protein